MAELVGVFAASHAPNIGRLWDSMGDPSKSFLDKSFREVGRRLSAVDADLVIEISPDHWVNFFMNNLPSVCLGVGEEHGDPPEAFMRDFPYAGQLRGDTGFADHVLQTAMDRDFEPSISHSLVMDHGFCIPLWRMHLGRLPKIMPIIVNDLEPPMISIRRCLAWGRMLRAAIESYERPLRVAILATGGLSHSIGEPTMGDIDAAFDEACVMALTAGDDATVIEAIEAGLTKTGNGGHEIRNWVMAHAAAGSTGFELISYGPVPEVYVGCAFAEWNLAR